MVISAILLSPTHSLSLADSFVVRNSRPDATNLQNHATPGCTGNAFYAHSARARASGLARRRLRDAAREDYEYCPRGLTPCRIPGSDDVYEVCLLPFLPWRSSPDNASLFSASIRTPNWSSAEVAWRESTRPTSTRLFRRSHPSFTKRQCAHLFQQRWTTDLELISSCSFVSLSSGPGVMHSAGHPLQPLRRRVRLRTPLTSHLQTIKD